MGIIDRLFRRNRETKTTPVAPVINTELMELMSSSTKRGNLKRKRTQIRKAKRQISKTSRRKNRR